MTSNQRRPGFRLPWTSEGEGAEGSEPGAPGAAPGTPPVDSAAQPATDASAAPADAENSAVDPSAPAAAAAEAPEAEASVETPEVEAAADRPPAAPVVAPGESAAGFMRDLVAAMRRVAEETRQSTLSDLRTKAEEQVRFLESDADRRREELKSRAEADIAGVGDWAKAEAERIRLEAEQRVVARRAQLDQQLAAETTRAETEARALRDRVAEYERELDAYNAQLSDIADPAAFAAAAKRMPAPPPLRPAALPHEPDPGPAAEPKAAPAPDAGTNGVAATREAVHPAEEEVLASRLAELDATLGPDDAEPAAPEQGARHVEPTSTEIVVKGLGSFGAITGFRQALAGVDGIDGVSLSLGPTGEFVFRAIHATGFDVAAAITTLEGDAAKIEQQPEGGLKVTLDRAR